LPLGGGIASVVAMDRNFRAPLAVNYVAGVEHELPHQNVVGASYAGSEGYNQLTGTDQNRFAGSLIQNDGTLVRLNPNYGSINFVDNANQSTYNALIVTFRGTPVAQARFQGSYMLSKVENYPEAGTRFDQDGGLGIPDPTKYFSYRGPANWDVRNRFTLAGSYVLPGMREGVGKVVTGGWQLSSIAVLETGSPYWAYNSNPFEPVCAGNAATSTNSAGSCTNNLGNGSWITGSTVTGNTGGDYNADGDAWAVPNLPGNNGQYTGSHTRSAYENGVFGNPTTGAAQAVFPVPTPGSDGNEPRNLYRNPGMIQWDASLIKNNPIEWIGPSGNLQLRLDFLNLPNHVNLSTVDPNMADSTFGKVTSALQSRQLQFGVHLAF
jgi:hypothetical protein